MMVLSMEYSWFSEKEHCLRTSGLKSKSYITLIYNRYEPFRLYIYIYIYSCTSQAFEGSHPRKITTGYNIYIIYEYKMKLSSHSQQTRSSKTGVVVNQRRTCMHDNTIYYLIIAQECRTWWFLYGALKITTRIKLGIGEINLPFQRCPTMQI